MPRERSARTLRRFDRYGWPQQGPGADEEMWPAHEAWPDEQQLRIGTSGWGYAHWKGRFFPSALKPAQHLAFFSRRLPTVEVNATYYRLPAGRVFEAWRDATPEGFVFTIKAPGLITHDKRLVDVDGDVDDFLGRLRPLRERLGMVLFQFPPGLKADAAPLLRHMLERLPPGPRYAVELRHRSWFERDTYMMLAERAVAFVVHDFNKRGTPLVETAPHVYLRLHGPSGRYRGSYDEVTLFQWAQQVREWMERGFEVFVYFNNDERGHAVRNAAALREHICGRSTLAGRRHVLA